MAVVRIRRFFGWRRFAPHRVRHDFRKQGIDLLFGQSMQIGELGASKDFGILDKQFLGHQVRNFSLEHAVQNLGDGTAGIGRDQSGNDDIGIDDRGLEHFAS